MNNKEVMIAPSILAADFGYLADEIKKIEEDADFLHFDVMDGHYVPNISFGIPVLRSIRPYSKLPFDVHLMIEKPLDYIPAFAKAGADMITFHVETVDDPLYVAGEIRKLGLRAGVSIHPDTPIDKLSSVLSEIDLVLIMSVRPGFGGQQYMTQATERIRAVREMLDSIYSNAILSVDGGLDLSNCRTVVKAGATLLVAGSTIFGAMDPASTVKELKKCAMS
jgi:ribulose-phosphate 3-epimerase